MNPFFQERRHGLPPSPAPEATPVGAARFPFASGGGRTVRFSSPGPFAFHDTGDRGAMPPPAAKSAGSGVPSPNRSGPAPASSPGRTAASCGRASPETACAWPANRPGKGPETARSGP